MEWDLSGNELSSMDISDKIEFPLAEKQRERAEKSVGITDHLQRKRGQYYATNRAKNRYRRH